MASSKAATVDEYMSGLPPERREAVAQVRKVILDNLPEGYEERMQYGMISYVIPLERYPVTYNKQPLAYVSVASQKNYMALYLTSVYSDPEVEQRLLEGYRATGKKPDMGKSCVRFKRLEDLSLEAIAEVIAMTPVDRMIERYEASRRK